MQADDWNRFRTYVQVFAERMKAATGERADAEIALLYSEQIGEPLLTIAEGLIEAAGMEIVTKEMAKVYFENTDICFAKRADGELSFTLLGRDPVAAKIIREWASARIAGGFNFADDGQIFDAMSIAEAMDRQRPEIRIKLGKPDAMQEQEMQLENLPL